MNKKTTSHTDGIVRIVGEGLQIKLGGKGEPAFSKSGLRKALNEAIDYLVKGGQVALAGKVYDTKRINFQITCMMAVEAPPETWSILMARQQSQPTDTATVPMPDGSRIPIVVPAREGVSRETESASETSGSEEEGLDQETENVPGNN